jgi:hypothetical protein
MVSLPPSMRAAAAAERWERGAVGLGVGEPLEPLASYNKISYSNFMIF